MQKFLIIGLGNPGSEYRNTRHNIGFLVLDALAGASNTVFVPDRYADVARISLKGRKLTLVKPSTYMNLSGKAVRYWTTQENIPLANVLVVTDDLALPFGTVRIRARGSDGGHNGLKSIQEVMGSTEYPRLRFGIGNQFAQGKQVDYVLGEWSEEEQKTLQERIQWATKALESFALAGLNTTMNLFNGK
jgi:PTH1 family peptidyl-tRNA hydrolase